MGWSSILKPVSKGVSKGFKGFSTWVSGTKWGSWLKVGVAGGTGAVIYSGWRSAVGSISDATGLSENHVQTILFVMFGSMVVYILVRMLTPGNGETVVNNYIPESKRAAGNDRGTKNVRGGRR